MQDKTKITKGSLDALIRQWNENPANADKKILQIDDYFTENNRSSRAKAAYKMQNITDDEYKDLREFGKQLLQYNNLQQIDLENILENLNEIKQQKLEEPLLIEREEDMQNNESPELDVYKEALIKLCKNRKLNETEYLTHALLSIFMYNIPQECSILCTNNNHCVLDGGGNPMSIDSLEKWFETNAISPSVNTEIMAETLYFIHCIKPVFNLGQASGTFKAAEFKKYAVDYAKAQVILKKMALKKLTDNEKSEIPEDIYEILDRPLHNLATIKLIDQLVENIESAEEINDLLKQYEVKFRGIKTLIDSEQYKEYKEKLTANKNKIEICRNFLYKCILAIMLAIPHCFTFWFTTESLSQRYNYYKDDYKKATTPETLKNFRSYIVSSLKKEVAGVDR